MKPRIKPTLMGWHLVGLIFALLLLSITYSNNLLLIFALIFLSLTIMWATESFYKNKGLSKIDFSLVDFFSDETKRINVPNELNFILGAQSKSFQVTNGELSVSTRGYYQFDSITVKSDLPFGLFEYRETTKINQSIYVYPNRIIAASKSNESLNTDEPDLMGLTRYQEKNPNRIHWKHYAKTHELVSKEFEESMGPDLLIEISDNPSEEMISHAAFEIHRAFQENRKFLLKIGSDEISDYTEALQRLAVC